MVLIISISVANLYLRQEVRAVKNPHALISFRGNTKGV